MPCGPTGAETVVEVVIFTTAGLTISTNGAKLSGAAFAKFAAN
jgi:hypothetical protein